MMWPWPTRFLSFANDEVRGDGRRGTGEAQLWRLSLARHMATWAGTTHASQDEEEKKYV